MQMRSPPSTALKIGDIGDHPATHASLRRDQNIGVNNVDFHVCKARELSLQSDLLTE